MLPPGFWARPFAHRGLHDPALGVIENSRAAVRAAIARGFGVEIDIQQSRDGDAMVFHDESLSRLTDRRGTVRSFGTRALQAIPLTGSDETIPSLRDVMEIVAGQVPLLLEIKDQDGAFGRNIGVLEHSVCAAIRDYKGPVALMSFNPHSVRLCARIAPDVPRGIVAHDFTKDERAALTPAERIALTNLTDFERARAHFVSYGVRSFPSPATAALRRRGVPVFSWTVRSESERETALRHSDQITFEGFDPA